MSERLYQSQRGGLGLGSFQEERYLSLVELLRSADIAFGNAECLFHNYEGGPSPDNVGTYMRADPKLIEDLRWMGFSMVACAQNHAYDYGDTGVLANIQYLEQYGLAHAGSGATLTLAQSPAYVDTPNGRVALIAT